MVRTGPTLGLGILGAIIGFHLGVWIAPTARIYFQISFLVLLFAVIILDAEPGWNLVLLFCFSLAAGMTLLWSDAAVRELRSWTLYLVLMAASLAGGAAIRGASSQVGRMLFLSTVLYMLGWIILAVVSMPVLVTMVWTILGLALFTIISIAVISHGKTLPQQESPVPLAVQIFVIQFNLCWLSALVWRMG